MAVNTSHIQAVLITGPTGSGKTPLGELCRERGLWNRRCVHFDFGAHLRQVSEGVHVPSCLTADELAVVTDALRTGALLENETFHIAEALLQERCTQCHGLNQTTSARKSRGEWDQTVTRMVSKGANLNDEEQTVLIDYLAQTYGP